MPYDDDQVTAIIERAIQKFDDTRRDRFEALVDKHEHLLYGNGKEGIVTKIDRIERAVSRWGSIGWRIVEVLVISGVVGLIIMIVQAGILKP